MVHSSFQGYVFIIMKSIYIRPMYCFLIESKDMSSLYSYNDLMKLISKFQDFIVREFSIYTLAPFEQLGLIVLGGISGHRLRVNV